MIAGFTFFQLVLMYGFAFAVVIMGLAVESAKRRQNDTREAFLRNNKRKIG